MPVIETKKALEGAAPGEVIEVIVDNEIAVQNLTKMANHKQLKSQSEKRSNTEFRVQIQAGENAAGTLTEDRDEAAVCLPDGRKGGTVVVLASNEMGSGDEVLGKLLMKGFVYALSQQEILRRFSLL